METITNVKIRLVTIADLYNFVAIAGKYDFDIELKSGRYTVDGKSIMGIYSLDLQSPIEMIIHSDDCPELMEKLSRFFTDEVGED